MSHLVYTLVLLGLLHLTRPAYLAFRRRKSGYGIVFNSVTGIPESLASVRLVTPGAYGQTVASAVTDKHGRYRLTGHAGEFIVEVKKAGFVFPSKYLKETSSVYENILPSARVILKDYGVITKNIPIDPEKVSAGSKVFGGLHLSKNAQYTLAFFSPIVLSIYPYLMKTSLIAWALFAIYLAVLIKRAFTFKPAQPAFGTLRDAESGEAIPKAIVRIFNAKFNKLLETQITSERGRYAFVVHPGAYYILIKREGYKGVRLNFPAIKEDGFLMAKDVRMKRSQVVESDEEPVELPGSEGIATSVGVEGF